MVHRGLPRDHGVYALPRAAMVLHPGQLAHPMPDPLDQLESSVHLLRMVCSVSAHGRHALEPERLLGMALHRACVECSSYNKKIFIERPFRVSLSTCLLIAVS